MKSNAEIKRTSLQYLGRNDSQSRRALRIHPNDYQAIYFSASKRCFLIWANHGLFLVYFRPFLNYSFNINNSN